MTLQEFRDALVGKRLRERLRFYDKTPREEHYYTVADIIADGKDKVIVFDTDHCIHFFANWQAEKLIKQHAVQCTRKDTRGRYMWKTTMEGE